MAWNFFGLFGGDNGDGAQAEAVPYEGFSISPAPRNNSGSWLTAGVISKTFEDGEIKEHHFIRAETHGDQAAAEAFSIIKGKQIVDEFGDRMFEG
ncbi:MAG: HlyU family transcriptional regulator [Alphaproteobacteria bacterium]|jgi:hypothetical protein